MNALMIITEPLFNEPFHMVLDSSDRAVLASGFGSLEELIARMPSAHQQLPQVDEAAEAPERAWIQDYAAGNLEALNRFTVRQSGTEFSQQCWKTLRSIAPGEPLTYSQFASEAGRPAAVRAAASTCAKNLVALVVPCHRVVRTDGSAGKYLFGTELKEKILHFEATNA